MQQRDDDDPLRSRWRPLKWPRYPRQVIRAVGPQLALGGLLAALVLAAGLALPTGTVQALIRPLLPQVVLEQPDDIDPDDPLAVCTWTVLGTLHLDRPYCTRSPS